MARGIRRAWTAAVAALLGAAAMTVAACDDGAAPTPPTRAELPWTLPTYPDVRLATPVAWAGGRIAFASDVFARLTLLPDVSVGGIPVTPSFVNPDSIILTAPDTDATLPVRVTFTDRAALLVGSVRVAGGYREYFTLPEIGGAPLAWPWGAVGSFVARGLNGTKVVDLTSGTSAVILDSLRSSPCILNAGPASRWRIVVSTRDSLGGCGPLVALRPQEPGFAQDTGPVVGYARFAAELAPGRWLVSNHHWTASLLRDTTGAFSGTTSFWTDEPKGITLSGRGHRAIVRGSSYTQGAPVFGPSTVEPLYRLPLIVDVRGAQFSDDGDTLYVAGASAGAYRSRGPDSIAIVRASDGVVLRKAQTPFWVDGLILDPGRPWLYLAVWTGGGAEGLAVYDRATLTHIVTYWLPPWRQVLQTEYPILDAERRKLYLVTGVPFGGPSTSTVDVFALLP